MSGDPDISGRLTQVEEQVRDRFLAPFIRCLPSWMQPNHITGLRICLVLISVLLYAVGQPLNTELWVLVVAAFTDTLDGPLARIRDRRTHTGALIDQVADWMLALWTGVLALSRGLLPGGLLLAMIIVHACMLAVDRLRASLLDARNRRVRALTIALGAANFGPNTVARLQFVTVLLGFFLLLFGRNEPFSLLRRLGLWSLYVEVCLTAFLVIEGFAKYVSERHR